MSDQQQIQRRFFKHIQKRYDSQAVFQGTMDILRLKKGAVYKRMSGESALTAAELLRLADHFNVSLDTALQQSSFISFEHPFIEDSSDFDFLDRMIFYLKPINQLEDSTLTYLANELPVFYYFSHQYIFTFLNAVWNHLHWKDNRLLITEPLVMDARLERLRTEINDYYAGKEITEIWNSNMLANLYQQVIFSITIRAFSDVGFIEKLVKDIEKLIQSLYALASAGEKTNTSTNTKFNIYLNEFGNYNNLLIYKSDKFKAAFIGYDMPQFLVSYNPQFIDYSEDWIQRIQKRSVLISSDGYQYRELYFSKIEKDFKQFAETADKLTSIYYA